MNFNFEKDISINKYKLDEECLSHPTLYFNYADACVQAKLAVSRASDKLSLVKAEANISIRDDLSSRGIKFTESIIASEVEKHPNVIKARDELREAEETYSRLQVAVQAMDARRAELDNLVKLYLAGYFAEPHATAQASERVNDRVSDSIRKNLNKERKDD